MIFVSPPPKEDGESLATRRWKEYLTRLLNTVFINLDYLISGASVSEVTSVAASATSVTLLDENEDRKGATFYNDSTSVCCLKLGEDAAADDFTVKIKPDGYFQLPIPAYTGEITCIWNSATGSMRITELT